VYVTEADGVTVRNLTVAVNRVGTDASVPETASGSATVTQEDLTTSSNGSIELISQSGSIVLNDGVSANGISVQANGSGSVLLKTLGSGSDIIATADIVSDNGTVDVLAARSVNFSGAADIRSLASVNVVATAGNVEMRDAKISAGSSQVTVKAEGTLTPGIVQTTGEVSLDVSGTGEIVFNNPVDRKGQNITVTSNRVDISQPLISVGADLVVTTLPSVSTPVDIRIGGVRNEELELHLTLGEFNNIQEGFNLITFGSSTQINQSIVVEGKNESGAPADVIFNDPVLFDVSAAGGHLRLDGYIYGEALTIKGTGSTTTLANNATTMQGNILIDDAVRVQGVSAVIAGDSGAGDLTITGTITGTSSSNLDTLTLRANGGDVLLKKAISGIDALTITSAIDVSFEGSIDITGALLIHATGDVKFSSALNLTAGGTLSILGANSITFANGVTVNGNITLDAKSLELLGGADSLQSSLSGSTLTIRSASTSNSIVIGNAVGPVVLDQLNLTTRDVTAIGQNFSQVIIGELGLGAVTVVGNTDLTSVAGADFVIYGNTITLLAGNVGGAVQVPGTLSLHASGNVLLNSGMSTAVTSNLSLVSDSGNLIMAQGTRLDSRGGDIDLKGTSLAVAMVNAWSSELTVGGVVKINAGSGTVTDANLNSTADVFAKAIDFTGYGPSTTSSGNVLEVVADVVQITVQQGLVVRDTGSDGRTYFNVMNGGQLYRQMVVEGTDVTRVTVDPAELLKKSDVELIAAGIPSNSPLLNAPIARGVSMFMSASEFESPSSFSFSPSVASPATRDLLAGDVLMNGMDLNGRMGDSDLLSDSSYGLASRLQQSYILGTPGEQPLISGLDSFSQDNFEYWVETLSL
jgi:hypothetical protein